MSAVSISAGPSTRTFRAPRATRPRVAEARGRIKSQAVPVRLTRRGRVVLTLLLLVLVLAALTVFSGQSAATRDAGTPVPTRTVVVEEGDTLWGIAADVAGPGEIREIAYEIQKLNSLPGPALVEGQELAVPVR